MKNLVVDTSILVDLRKVSALHLWTKLPFELITTTIIASELTQFTPEELQLLFEGLYVSDLTPEHVQQSIRVSKEQSGISVADASVLVLAETLPDSILLTGDKRLRKLAHRHGVEVHGTIWLFRQFFYNGIGAKEELIVALEKLNDDGTVRLPSRQVSALIVEIRDTIE